MTGKQILLGGMVRTASVRSTRSAGFIPAVLYGHDLASKNVQVEKGAFAKVLKEAGQSSLVSLKLDDNSEHAVLIRDLQHHPVKDAVVHVDFYQVRMDEEIEAAVPLRMVGEAPAVKNLSGVLVRNLDEVTVSALPTDLPHDIEIDISVLDDFSKTIRIEDLKLPKGVTLRHEADEVVLLVQEPRSEQEIEQLSTEVKEDVEAVEGVKKEEPAEGETEAAAPAEEKKE